MAFIPIPSTAEVALRFLQDGQNVANVWHVRYEGAPNETIMSTIASATIAYWQSDIRPFVSNSVTLLEVAVVDQSTQNGIGRTLAPASNNVGQDSSPQLPNNNTIAIKRNTGFTGRSFRGRIYHVGLTEAQVTANQVAPATIATLNGAYSGWIDAYEQINCEWVVASRYSNNAPRINGVATPVLGVSTNPVVDSQRRRLPGRGR